jgi:hypothetical protein
MRIRQRVSVKRPKGLSDFYTFLIYIITLYCTLVVVGDAVTFYNKGICKYVKAIDDKFTKATSVEMVNSYISEELIPALHQVEVHNCDGIKERCVTPLYGTKLLGLARIRQLRVMDGR